MAEAAVYAVVDGEGTVINVILWDGVSEWAPPDGTSAVPDATGEGETRATIGGTYDAETGFHDAA